jgi:hypothetical protein
MTTLIYLRALLMTYKAEHKLTKESWQVLEGVVQNTLKANSSKTIRKLIDRIG